MALATNTKHRGGNGSLLDIGGVADGMAALPANWQSGSVAKTDSDNGSVVTG